ncbi:MAG: deoxyribonuclease IV [Candidatus Kariarchaeaceae archaeon]
MKIGAHVSIAGGFHKSVKRALELSCDCFQIFTRSPRMWNYKPLDEKTITLFKEARQESDLGPLVSHMPYLPNLSSPDEDLFEKSSLALYDELQRCKKLGVEYICTHLGSDKGDGKGEGRIVEALISSIEKSTIKGDVIILLENTASLSRLGGNLSHIGNIIEKVEERGFTKYVGFLMDTCHAFAAGYDLRTEEAVEKTVEKIDTIIGIDKLHAIHANDSKGELGSGKDRHEHIALGKIGAEGFKAILHNKKFRKLPFYLETHDKKGDKIGHKQNLAKLRELAL